MISKVEEILLKSAERYTERLAVQDPTESVTYAQLAADSMALAQHLLALGLKPQGRVLIVLPNSVNFVRAHFAAIIAGGISVPVDYAATETTFLKITNDCKPDVILIDKNAMLRLGKAISQVGIPASSADSFRGSKPPTSTAWMPKKSPGMTAALMYTTGSTSQPKGVILTHTNILAALNNITQFVGYTKADREVITLPLSHNFGLGHLYCNLMSGGAVYTEHGLTRVKRVLNAIESFGATGFPTTPLGLSILINQYGIIFQEKAKNLRFMVVNSSPLPPAMAAKIIELFPRLDLMVYYGLTEASRSTFISLSKSGPNYYRSVGKPMPGIDLWFDEGEVVISGPTVTQGYWNQPNETAQNLHNGRLRTGDIGHLDENGYLFITGRKKDIINIGGLKVSPAEIEDVIKLHEDVEDVGVVGFETDQTEQIVAALVPKRDSFKTAPIEQLCHARLENFKVPTRFTVVDKIPRSETGKIKRHELKETIARLAEANQ